MKCGPSDMNENQIETLLNEALERFSHGATVEDCLLDYPKEVGELEPLLRLAHAISIAIPGPRLAAKQEILVRILEEWEKRNTQKSGRFHFPDLSIFSRPMAAALSIGIVLLIVGWSTTIAAADTVPGDFLYPMKTAQEQVILGIGSSPYHKARIHARLAAERSWEMEILAVRPVPSSEIDRLARRMVRHTLKSAMLKSPKPELVRSATKPWRESRHQVQAFKSLIKARKHVRELLVKEKRLQDRRFQVLNVKQQNRLQYAFQQTQEQLHQTIQILAQLEQERNLQGDPNGNELRR
jgi:hypothetical protein